MEKIRLDVTGEEGQRKKIVFGPLRVWKERKGNRADFSPKQCLVLGDAEGKISLSQGQEVQMPHLG